jgi:hypothetical protein
MAVFGASHGNVRTEKLHLTVQGRRPMFIGSIRVKSRVQVPHPYNTSSIRRLLRLCPHYAGIFRYLCFSTTAIKAFSATQYKSPLTSPRSSSTKLPIPLPGKIEADLSLYDSGIPAPPSWR